MGWYFVSVMNELVYLFQLLNILNTTMIKWTVHKITLYFFSLCQASALVLSCPVLSWLVFVLLRGCNKYQAFAFHCISSILCLWFLMILMLFDFVFLMEIKLNWTFLFIFSSSVDSKCLFYIFLIFSRQQPFFSPIFSFIFSRHDLSFFFLIVMISGYQLFVSFQICHIQLYR